MPSYCLDCCWLTGCAPLNLTEGPVCGGWSMRDLEDLLSSVVQSHIDCDTFDIDGKEARLNDKGRDRVCLTNNSQNGHWYQFIGAAVEDQCETGSIAFQRSACGACNGKSIWLSGCSGAEPVAGRLSAGCARPGHAGAPCGPRSTAQRWGATRPPPAASPCAGWLQSPLASD